ncbi:fungal-specific transcription factor domain-containing protein [Flagelloscypha sp. PMI_526]|nr:fungal-specific transcription factor domain-containing protein [Flagelloscypha sp. PMI_526]
MIPGPTPPSGQESFYDYHSAYSSHGLHAPAPPQAPQPPWNYHNQHYVPQQQGYSVAAQAPQQTYYQSQQSSYDSGPTTNVPIQQTTSTSPGGRAAKRKRVAQPAHPANGADSDGEDGNLEDFLANGGISVGMGGLGVQSSYGSGGVGRLPGACTHCKKLKMKCEFSKNSNTCRRCQSGGHVCIVEGRKPRTAPNKREYLLAQIRQKDAIIESLLKQLHNPYVATPMSIASYRMATSPGDETKGDVLGWLEKLESSLRSDKQFAASPSIPGASSPPSPSTIANTADTNPFDRDRDRNDMLKEGTGTLSFARKHYPSLTPEREELQLGEGDSDGEEDDGSEDEDGSDRVEDARSTLPDAAVPLGLLATLSLGNASSSAGASADGGGASGAGVGLRKKDGKEAGSGGAAASAAEVLKEEAEDLDDERIGVANEGYFQPGPAIDLGKRALLIEQHSPPEILVHGLVAPKDVDVLFKTFFDKVNPFLGLLDPVLHTPATTFARCPFLFTVICAVSSRYYPPKAEIYPIAMHFAKHAAANALIDGWKTVELVQAYILMSVYAVPARRWEEDRSWLYTGLAIRIATDLNLHRTPSIKPSTATSLPSASPHSGSGSTPGGKSVKKEKEIKEREILNRTRIWMVCFNLDRSTATQFGKPSTIKDDFITLACGEFYLKSSWNDPYDVHLCAYTALLQVVSKFQAEIYSDPRSPTGLNKKIDFRSVTLAHDVHLTNYHEEWSRRFKETSDPADPGCRFRTNLLPFLVSYSRLVMFSFGFQQAFQRGMKDEDKVFFTKCLESAKQVIKVFIEKLVPTGYMRYSPDGHFIFASFASAFLLKLLRPEFSSLLPQSHAHENFELIGNLIQTLSSGELAIDERHTPKLYARFLAGLLSRYKRAESAVASPPHTSSHGSGSGPVWNDYGGFSFNAGGRSNLHGQSQQGYGSYGAGGYGLSASSSTPSPQPHTGPGVHQSYHGSGHSQSQAPYSAPSSDSESVVFTPPDTTAMPTIVTSPDSDMAPPAPSMMQMGPDQSGQQQQQQPHPEYMNQQGPPTDEATLAAMFALKNPAWWDNMMMPGYVHELIDGY